MLTGENYKPKERIDDNSKIINELYRLMYILYDRGYADGEQDGEKSKVKERETITDVAYEHGLEAAWAAAKKLMDMSREEKDRIFDSPRAYEIIRDRTPSTVISMLERYEKDKKAAEEIQQELDKDFAIGNIVCNKQLKSFRLMVVRRYVDNNGIEKFCGVDDCGFYHDKAECENFSWTGIHSGYMDFMKVPE